MTTTQRNTSASLTRRLLLACAAAPWLVSASWAQPSWPSKPITLVVPFPPGGPTDVVSRLVGKELAERLKQPLIVENRAGASGSIAASQVQRAPADGYTLMMVAAPTLFAPYFFKNAGYETPKDFTPIATVYDLPIVMVVNPVKMPGVESLSQLIAYAKANPGKLNYTTSGAGSFGHMTMERLKDLGHFDMQHVAYKGGTPAITDTIGGQVPMMYADLVAALPHIKSGRLKALAVGSPIRVPAIPEVKTIAEQGFAGFDAVSWGGLLAPKGTPKDVVDRLNKELKEILAQKDVQDRILGAGAIGRYQSAAELHKRLTDDYVQWGKVVREKGMAAE